MRFVAIAGRPYDTWRMRIALTVLALGAAAFLPLRADAYGSGNDLRAGGVEHVGEAAFRVVKGNCMSLSEAIESVRRQTGGKVISAETRIQGGREVHHIKVLTKDGKVRTRRVSGCKR